MSHHILAERIVVVSRVIDGPREEVFQAFADPKQLAKWWAPEPLTIPMSEADFRVGGRYRYVMRDQDGNDFTATGVFKEIVEPERIVYSDSLDEMPSSWVDMVNEARGKAKGTPVPDSVVTVTFEEVEGGKTKVNFTDEFDTKAYRDAMVKMQMVEGLNGGFDNLEKMLAKQHAGAK